MDKPQTKEFLNILADAYPNLELKTNYGRAKLWAKFMAEIEYSIAMKHLKKHIATSKFPPSIAEILNPDEANRKGQRVEDQPTSPAGIMAGRYVIYDPAKH